MKRNYTLFFFLLVSICAHAQKPFTEGVIIYDIKLESADHQQLKGAYVFTIKGSEIKKELKLDNGYRDVILMNCSTGAVYSLQNANGKKYAIQLSMSDMQKKQEQYAGYVIRDEQTESRKIADMATTKCNLVYKNGTQVEIYYNGEWMPSQSIMYERFPDAKFIPLGFTYTDEHGMTLQFNAAEIEPSPVDNAVFRIPIDYKMISYKEYKELSR